MIWPPQNTGLFAVADCARCSGVPEEYCEVWFENYSPDFYGTSYTIVFTPSARDPMTQIVGTGYIEFTRQAYGAVTCGTGCYGYQCVDEFGNPVDPYGSAEGWQSGTTTHQEPFYITSAATHGKATDLLFTNFWMHITTTGTNMPTCTDPSGFWDSIIRTMRW